MANTNDERLGMIVVMGVTGAGKSYLINRLAGRTQKCQLVPVVIGNSRLLVVDTPGFDDADRTDSEILNEIARIISAQYMLGVELRGVVYVHRITDVRYAGSSVKTFEIFKKICGEEALKNVLLVTSRWSEVAPVTGAARERELRDKFWAYMLDKGSNMSRFHGDGDSAISLISQLLEKDSVVLDIQRELVDRRMRLHETCAGAYLQGNAEAVKLQCEDELAGLTRLKRSIPGNNRAMSRQVRRDWDQQQARLARAQQDSGNLAVPVAKEVQHEMGKKRRIFRRGEQMSYPASRLKTTEFLKPHHLGHSPIPKTMASTSEEPLSEEQNEAESVISSVDFGSMAESIPSHRGRQALSDTTPYTSHDREQLGHKPHRKKKHRKYQAGPSASPKKARSEGGSPKKGFRHAFSALGHALNKVESNLLSGQDYKPYGRHKYTNPRLLDEFNARIHEEQIKAREEQARSESIQHAARQLQATMDHKELPMGAQCTDSEIYEIFESLRYAINTWSYRFSSVAEHGSFSSEDISRFSLVVPNVRDLPSLEALLASDNINRRFFIRGWATYAISTRVLQDMNLWMGEAVSANFLELENVFKDAVNGNTGISLRDFHNWRSLTAHLAAQIQLPISEEENIEVALSDGAEGAMEAISPWVDQEAVPDIEARFIDLFKQALRLSTILKQQRAHWWFDWPREKRRGEGLMFDPNTMLDVRGNDERLGAEELRVQPVELVLSPALYKRGNAAGEHFDKDGYCVAESLVVMRLLDG
ncbi:uncharacterized protein BKCO1_14000150 [Diplodia corticola]|uniref:G domain-containing protein n=1 Tax=Diplodia corticola TaxID=236234 RepID=A0A1J9RTS3_9PEZI|nr:uncharacterized protein BKCO1_14000150 [Diplodia corticola]OJD35963.1 hypothetical protein BKCO1_14000150 [Diplodia corticola]